MMILGKFNIQKRKVIMEFPRVTQNIRYCHKKGHIRSECWLRKKKQPDANITELVKGNEEQHDVLSVTDKPVGNKDKLVINSGCSQYISSNMKMFSSYTSVQGK